MFPPLPNDCLLATIAVTCLKTAKCGAMICKDIPTIMGIGKIHLREVDGIIVDVMREQDLSASNKCVINVFPIATIASSNF